MSPKAVFGETLFVEPDPGLEKRQKRSKWILGAVITFAIIGVVIAIYVFIVVPILR